MKGFQKGNTGYPAPKKGTTSKGGDKHKKKVAASPFRAGDKVSVRMRVSSKGSQTATVVGQAAGGGVLVKWDVRGDTESVPASKLTKLDLGSTRASRQAKVARPRRAPDLGPPRCPVCGVGFTAGLSPDLMQAHVERCIAAQAAEARASDDSPCSYLMSAARAPPLMPGWEFAAPGSSTAVPAAAAAEQPPAARARSSRPPPSLEAACPVCGRKFNLSVSSQAVFERHVEKCMGEAPATPPPRGSGSDSDSEPSSSASDSDSAYGSTDPRHKAAPGAAAAARPAGASPVPGAAPDGPFVPSLATKTSFLKHGAATLVRRGKLPTPESAREEAEKIKIKLVRDIEAARDVVDN
ncbi:hypothetical protein TeGR_g15094, partial [Tetraparma gracilis]